MLYFDLSGCIQVSNLLRCYKIQLLSCFIYEIHYFSAICILLFSFTKVINNSFPSQLSATGFEDLANGCTQVQTFILNDIPTLDDFCVKVWVCGEAMIFVICTRTKPKARIFTTMNLLGLSKKNFNRKIKCIR